MAKKLETIPILFNVIRLPLSNQTLIFRTTVSGSRSPCILKIVVGALQPGPRRQCSGMDGCVRTALEGLAEAAARPLRAGLASACSGRAYEGGKLF